MAEGAGTDPLRSLVRLPTPMVRIDDGMLRRRGVEVWIKLEGESHPHFGGNKLRKLAPNLAQAAETGVDRVLAFGIAPSTLLYSVACACRELSLASTGIVPPSPRSERSLARLRENDMTLIEVPRAVYDQAAPEGRVDLVPQNLPQGLVLPEGGSNTIGVANCASIVDEIDRDVDLIAAPIGTGGTVAGLALGAAGRARVLGFTSLFAAAYDADRLRRYVVAAGGDDPGNWSLCRDYASRQPVPPVQVRSFMRAFEQTHGIELDSRYNGKLLFGLWDLIERGEIARGTCVVAVHTGGLETGEHRLPHDDGIVARGARYARGQAQRVHGDVRGRA